MLTNYKKNKNTYFITISLSEEKKNLMKLAQNEYLFPVSQPV